jgi:DNA-binding NarL/FixJ family response regulator
MMGKPRLLLVDDHPLLLDGLRLELQEEFEIVAMLTCGVPVAGECRRLRPDAVLLDLSLKDRSGLEVMAEIQAEAPGTRVLIVTMHADRVLADACMHAGARGFVPKDADVEELRLAVRTVLAGDVYVSPQIRGRGAPCSTIGVGYGLSQLTERQRQILLLLGEGLSSAQIATRLRVTLPTVTFHRKRIRETLGIANEWGLTRLAIVIRMNEEAQREVQPKVN